MYLTTKLKLCSKCKHSSIQRFQKSLNCAISYFFDSLENIKEKRGHAVYPAFSPFSCNVFKGMCPLDINPFPNKPGLYIFAVKVFGTHCGKRRNCL